MVGDTVDLLFMVAGIIGRGARESADESAVGRDVRAR
jgi:hypothetical protein